MLIDGRVACPGGTIGGASDLHLKQVQFLTVPLSHSDPRQDVHTHVPSFTKQYKLVPAKGGDAPKLGR